MLNPKTMKKGHLEKIEAAILRLAERAEKGLLDGLREEIRDILYDDNYFIDEL